MPDAMTKRQRTTHEAPRLDRLVFIAACARQNALTEQQRADLCNVTRKAIDRYLKGEVAPMLTTARRIADRLQVDVDRLWPAA
jgi:transcriptional regulator with XRE-family HTH domain